MDEDGNDAPRGARDDRRRLSWDRDGRDWPNRDASRFVRAAGLTWHVQVMGEGPVLLLLHGTGATTHSWRAFAPRLAAHFTVVAPDLPGHGFTDLPPRAGLSWPGMSLHGIARGVRDLLSALDLAPRLAIGHSAGAAILARMCLDGLLDLDALICLNGALRQLPGMTGRLFAPLAKVLAQSPAASHLFAWSATQSGVARMVEQTGSVLDTAGIEFYARLAANPGHVAAALGMMANWDLPSLERDLPRLRVPIVLIVGSKDRTISPEDAFAIRKRVSGAHVECLAGLGHLAHEEKPDQVAELVLRLLATRARPAPRRSPRADD